MSAVFHTENFKWRKVTKLITQEWNNYFTDLFETNVSIYLSSVRIPAEHFQRGVQERTRNWQTWESTPWPRPYCFHQSITYDSISCLVKLFGTPQDVVKASKQMTKWREARWGPAGHCWGLGLTPWLGNREPAGRTAQPKHRGWASELTALQSNDRCFSVCACRVFFKRRTKHQLEYHII